MFDTGMPEQMGEVEVPEVTDFSAETSKRVKKALKKASSKAESVKVAGVEVDPDKAYKNLQTALSLVRTRLKMDDKDLYFQQFPGPTVGEAEADGKIKVDPILLMHPAVRLAHVIAHELAHKGGDVDHEALVEAYIGTLGLVGGDGFELTQKYSVALEKFYEFVERVSGGRDMTETVKKIYELYYSGEYEAIYELYERRYMAEFATDENQDEAFRDFEAVFPEFIVRGGGRFDAYRLEDVSDL